LKVVYILVGAAFAAVVADRLRSLVKRVVTEQQKEIELEKEKQKLIESVNIENRKYLENVSEGLVLIDRTLAMKNQFSTAFVEIFNDNNISGKSFLDLIFPEKEKHASQRRELENFLSILFNNDTADVDMILDINPVRNRVIAIVDKEGEIRKKNIEINFKRVFAADNSIENIMVMVVDKTHDIETKLELEDEKSKREEEIDMIQNILKISPVTLNDFF
jgi:hypothetical protein